jgi:raffinose/stachyose/melibiose transport system substrate-binding protein
MKRCLVVALTVLVAGFTFAGGEQEDAGPSSDPVTVRFLSFQTGVHPEADWFAWMVDEFNEEYDGEIVIDVDYVNGENAYWEKLRSDAGSGSMPDVFMLGTGDPFKYMSSAGMLQPLDEFMKGESRVNKDLFDDTSLAAYQDEEGRQLEIPYAKANVGIYYNKDLFENAGIEKFPKTWDEFFRVCDTLKAQGITPLSLMTGENAWTTMLLMASYIGTHPGGVEWMTTPSDEQTYNTREFIEGVRFVQRVLQDYTTPDAIGAGYGIAANHFLQGETAMIPNGPWMVGTFSDPDSAPEGFESKVGYAVYPGNGIISIENVGFAMGSTDPEKQEAAWEVLKFLTREEVYARYLSVGGAGPTIDIDLSEVTYPRLIEEFTPDAVAAEYKYPIIQQAMKPANSDAMEQYLPDLAAGRMSPEEFADTFQQIHESN